MARSERRTLKSRFGALVGLVLLSAATLLTTGCVAGAHGEVVYGYPVVEATYVPARIEYYPRAYYRGSYAYYVDGRWYYPSSGSSRGWVVFREEPTELRRYRVEERWERRPPDYRGPQYGTPRQRYPYDPYRPPPPHYPR